MRWRAENSGTTTMAQFSDIWLRSFDVGVLEKIIEEFNLHNGDNYPVSAHPLYEALSIKVCTGIELPPGIDAFTYRNRYADYGVAAFSRALSEARLNHAIFHELGHLLFGEGEQGKGNRQRHGCVSKGGVVRKEEVEADLFACYLAAPGWKVRELFAQGYDFEQVCRLLVITPRLLELRVELLKAKGKYCIPLLDINID